jgi:hypothetical protein
MYWSRINTDNETKRPNPHTINSLSRESMSATDWAEARGIILATAVDIIFALQGLITVNPKGSNAAFQHDFAVLENRFIGTLCG